MHTVRTRLQRLVRGIAHTAMAGLVALATVVGLAAPAVAQTEPDLVVIVVDDLGWEDVAFLPTPNVDALLTTGRTFLAHHTDPFGASTRFALNYGAYGARERLGFELDPTDPASVGASTERISIAQSLRLERYASVCVGRWGITGSADANVEAAARICGWSHWLAGVPTRFDAAGGETHHAWKRVDDGAVTDSTTYSTTAVVDAFVTWWARPTTRPRLAYVAFPAPAAPFDAAPPALLPSGHPVPNTNRERYESAVLALDHELGRLVAALDLSRTVVVLTSDGGTPNQVAPPSAWFPGYGGSAYGGGVRVPLIVAGTGVTPGISTRVTHAADVPATLLELAGRPTPPVGFEDGVSFGPDLLGTPTTRSPVLCLSFLPNGTPTPQLERWCVVDDAGNKLMWDGTQEFLFDLAVDPFETTPLPVGAPGSDPLADALRQVKSAVAP